MADINFLTGVKATHAQNNTNTPTHKLHEGLKASGVQLTDNKGLEPRGGQADKPHHDSRWPMSPGSPRANEEAKKNSMKDFIDSPALSTMPRCSLDTGDHTQSTGSQRK